MVDFIQTFKKSVLIIFFILTAVDQDIRTVELTKGPSDSLGISIAGGVGSPLGDIPIFIAMMNPAGLAAQTQLKVQDSPLTLPVTSSFTLQQSVKQGMCIFVWFNAENLSYAAQS